MMALSAPAAAADPLKSWIDQTAAEAGLRYQFTVQRLEQERQARASYDP